MRWRAEYNLASYVRRADTRVLSVLYQLWCGNHDGYHPEPADMSERRYESATFDTDPMALSGRCTVTVLGSIARIKTDGYYSLSIGGEGVSSYFDNISIWD